MSVRFPDANDGGRVAAVGRGRPMSLALDPLTTCPGEFGRKEPSH